MPLRFINPQKLMEKIKSGEPLPELLAAHKELIAERTEELVQLCFEEQRDPTDEEVSEIVELRLQLDDLYGSWIEGTL